MRTVPSLSSLRRNADDIDLFFGPLEELGIHFERRHRRRRLLAHLGEHLPHLLQLLLHLFRRQLHTARGRQRNHFVFGKPRDQLRIVVRNASLGIDCLLKALAKTLLRCGDRRVTSDLADQTILTADFHFDDFRGWLRAERFEELRVIADGRQKHRGRFAFGIFARHDDHRGAAGIIEPFVDSRPHFDQIKRTNGRSPNLLGELLDRRTGRSHPIHGYEGQGVGGNGVENVFGSPSRRRRERRQQHRRKHRQQRRQPESASPNHEKTPWRMGFGQAMPRVSPIRPRVSSDGAFLPPKKQLLIVRTATQQRMFSRRVHAVPIPARTPGLSE